MSVDTLRRMLFDLLGVRARVGWSNTRVVTKWSPEGWERAKPHFDESLRLRASGDIKGAMQELAKAESYAYDQVTAAGNILLNEGGIEMWNLIVGATGTTAYNNANARTGVGDSGVAPTRAQTGLQGAATTFKAMLPTYPTAPAATTSGVEIRFKSEFLSGEANHAWAEQTIDNGAAQNKNIFRTNTNLGTKATGTWTLETILTLQ